MRTKCVDVSYAFETKKRLRNLRLWYAFETHMVRIWYVCLTVCVSNADNLLREGLTSMKSAF